MFNIFKKKAEDINTDVREVLFGDRDLSQWCKGSGVPWNLFAKAKNEISIDEKQKAIETLKTILKLDGLESRHYVQAWYFLRQLGIFPDDKIGSKVYGVIIEVSLNKGLDIVAVYDDHSARYFNYSGAAVIWEHPNNSLDETLEKLISISQTVVNQIGPWDKERPKPPIKGNARINFLTPSGLHFGEGPINLLSKDPMGGAVITIALEIMQKLIEHANEPKKAQP